MVFFFISLFFFFLISEELQYVSSKSVATK
jgi:hypothetical protein